MRDISAAEGQERKALEIQFHEVIHGNFGGVVWWQWHRLVHGTALSVYCILTFANVRYAYIFGIIDVAYGLLAGIIYYRLSNVCTIQVDR